MIVDVMMTMIEPRTILIYLIFLSLAGCKKLQTPDFVTVKEVKVVSLDKKKVVLEGIAIFSNPNDFKLQVKEIAVDVTINEVAMGQVNQLQDFDVPANADFEVPMVIAFAPKDVYKDLFSSLLDVLNNKKMEVYYNGFVRMKSLGVTIKVPIDHREEIRI